MLAGRSEPVLGNRPVAAGSGAEMPRQRVRELGPVRKIGVTSLVLIILWTLLILRLGVARFAIYSPAAEVGEEAATALAAFFSALVLTLFPPGGREIRLRWVAAGFVVLGLGALMFGYLAPLAGASLPLNTTMYIALTVRVVVGLLFLIGLLPENPPPMTGRRAAAAGIVTAGLLVAMPAVAAYLPPLVSLGGLREAIRDSSGILDGLTFWHWILSPISLLLTIGAIVGVARHFTRHGFDAWLLVSLIFLAGSQLHNVFWPSTYTGVLTTANLLRLTFAMLIAVGAIIELRRIAVERSVLLAVARERGRRLEDLADLKASFTAMVAHELGSPLAAIRGMAAVLATGDLKPEDQAEALQIIDTQIDMLAALTADMQSASSVERPEFAVHMQPVPVRNLVLEAQAFARTFDGNHPLIFPASSGETVLGDRERIGQVLRNLLSNAAKYSEAGASIEMSLERHGSRLWFTVRDQGYGIHPDDMQRIFEKFGRGRDRSGRRVSGVGLGLYLSRRIVQVHGSDLSVESIPGHGSTFSFSLEVIE